MTKDVFGLEFSDKILNMKCEYHFSSKEVDCQFGSHFFTGLLEWVENAANRIWIEVSAWAEKTGKQIGRGWENFQDDIWKPATDTVKGVTDTIKDGATGIINSIGNGIGDAFG